MSVPGRVEAARLLRSLNPPPWFLRHSRAVAEVAAWLAARAAAAGLTIDRSLVEAAALLHDIDKVLPRDDPARRLPHGAAGAAWLTDCGFADLAPAVAAHPVTNLADDAWWQRWQRDATLEERIVAYADKRVGQRLGSMDARFSDWARRYPTAPGETGAAGRMRERAAELEARLTRELGIAPEGVRRLRWTHE